MNKTLISLAFIALSAAVAPAMADVLMTTTYGGAVSVSPNLSAKTCQRAVRSLLRYDEIEAEAKTNSAPCPSDKGAWEEFQKTHNGCTVFDKNGKWAGETSWGGGRIVSETDIKSAVCLK